MTPDLSSNHASASVAACEREAVPTSPGDRPSKLGTPVLPLLALLALALLIAALVSLGLAAAVGAARARASIIAEVGSALQAQASICRVLVAPGGVGAADGARLAHVFDGDRHVRVVVTDARGRTLAVSRPQSAAAPPGIVSSWLWPHLAPRLVTGRAISLRLEPWPANEVAETWERARDAGAALVAFWLVAGGLAWFLTARALQPVAGLLASTERLGAGDYAARAPLGGAAELRRLGAAFNATAARLQASEARARVLAEALARAHQSERAAIARDLHDGLGAELFGARVDANVLVRGLADNEMLEPRRRAEILFHSVGRMQCTVRELLARLRPSAPSDLGLQAAVVALVDDWQRRTPQTDITYSTDGVEPTRLELRDAGYRLVQEALHNSIRHGHPKMVHVCAFDVGGELRLTVVDDGSPAGSTPSQDGLGLLGMRERMLACAGCVDVGPLPSGGWQVHARAPLNWKQPLQAAA